jgi:hypothetical protein
MRAMRVRDIEGAKITKLAERGPMLCTAETSPLHYLPPLDLKSSSLQL